MPKFRAFLSFKSLAAAAADRVDKVNGIIKGVSLISIGEAKGHNCYADDTTLDQVLACAQEYQSGLRVMFNPETFAHGKASIAGLVPIATMRKEGEKAVGDIHITEGYQHRDYLLNLAITQPDTFGLSIEFFGPTEEIDGLDYARCDEIYAVTVVDQPAANKTGLFSIPLHSEIAKANSNPNKPTKHMPLDAADLEALSKKLSENNTALMSQFETKLTAVTKPLADSVKKLEDGAKTKEEEEEEKAKAKAKEDELAKEPASEEELAAAGVAKGDSAEVKLSKVVAFRKGLDAPMTVRSFFSHIRKVGNPAAGASQQGGHDEEGKGAKSFFEARIKPLMESGGLSQAIATKTAIRNFGAEYSKHLKAGTVMPAGKQTMAANS